ncbi:ribokinase [Halolactibacillus halophilus]|uniref:Ribokinase n=1 Tax=Halolactibacillus halophilus TaxID=306540 RepID=A0A1I5N3C9_9BACI|nr:ribokinase [Halolactibacillus halophilus]GEM01086.1 ribokinase [Halolactibacillus halophilus]SFP15791.1 ribokinase [Halolactibacillus halophilus]
MKQKQVTVIGSINLDMVTTSDRIPHQGETMMGTGFNTVPGGKGANQAVAAARLGADVTMIGCVGDDPFGKVLIENLQREGVLTDYVEPVTDVPSGVATILVSDGDNRIIVTPGANDYVTPTYVEKYLDVIDQSNIVVLQLEIPLKTIEYVTGYCYRHNIPVILNPAPIQEVPDDVLKQVTYVTPNETEVTSLDVGKEKLIVTEGKQGVRYFQNGKVQHVPGFNVTVEDTTGAGDTFNGALAVYLAENHSLKEAIIFANAAAALSVRKFGAQGGMPSRSEVIELMKKGGQ